MATTGFIERARNATRGVCFAAIMCTDPVSAMHYCVGEDGGGSGARPAVRAPAKRVAQAAPAAVKPAPTPPAPKKFEFETLQLVHLRRGAKWTPAITPAVEALQKQHIGHLEKMGNSGKAVVCGPLDDQDDKGLAGICLYRVSTLAEARALAEQDPAVKAGRLRVEVATWYYGKGFMTFPKAPVPSPTPSAGG